MSISGWRREEGLLVGDFVGCSKHTRRPFPLEYRVVDGGVWRTSTDGLATVELAAISRAVKRYFGPRFCLGDTRRLYKKPRIFFEDGGGGARPFFLGRYFNDSRGCDVAVLSHL